MKTPIPPISRRQFIGQAAGLAALAPAIATARPPVRESGMKRILAYVGTYSSSRGEAVVRGNGRGIHAFELDPSSGRLAPAGVTEMGSSPSSLAFNPARTRLYSANEAPAAPGDGSGSVSALAIDRKNGGLRLLNTASSGGAGPAHLSVHPGGRHVLVANYGAGSVAVLPIGPGGEVGPPSDLKHDRGRLGPLRASSAAPGSFAISGHDAPHAHMVQSDPSGRFVLSTDLGLDRIYVWRYDGAAGRLSPAAVPYATVPPGDGPRHFAFHPNGRWLYCLTEEGSTVVLFDYDGATGGLHSRQSLSSLPPDFAGTSFASEIAVSADGRFVYAANRLHDSIAWFGVGENGNLTLLGEEWTRGDYPRNFGIDPSGNFLFSCNHRGDSVTSFRIDRQTGALRFTGGYTPVGSPSIIVFLAL